MQALDVLIKYYYKMKIPFYQSTQRFHFSTLSIEES